jgi:nitrile hydratase
MFLPFVFAGLNLDQFRHGIEKLHPVEYLAGRYYEHWLHTVEHHTVRAGVIDPEELERRTRYYLENPDAPVPEKEDPELAARMEALARSGVPARRDSDRPARFAVGDRVRVKDDSPFGHTRRARYIRGRTGVIEAAHGTFIYPDSAGNGGGDDPQHVYTVVFRATDLWGEPGDPNATVTFDVWEPYLDQA